MQAYCFRFYFLLVIVIIFAAMVPWMVGIRGSTKQGFWVENTSTHSVREQKRNPSTTDFFVACCTSLLCVLVAYAIRLINNLLV